MKNNNKKDSQKFEDAFERLKEVVSLIEKSENNLEDLVELVEEGTRLSKFCKMKLEKVQEKITVINDRQKTE